MERRHVVQWPVKLHTSDIDPTAEGSYLPSCFDNRIDAKEICRLCMILIRSSLKQSLGYVGPTISFLEYTFSFFPNFLF